MPVHVSEVDGTGHSEETRLVKTESGLLAQSYKGGYLCYRSKSHDVSNIFSQKEVDKDISQTGR
ncbi:16281_t:CDS:2 [Acaulospora morrowiae]|uniref:16281_t:CDS:1 n=1 Tax=Acaulospora morrowiae TaxID=94023 RepID=A0A9N9GHF6_9GLOM|nr:16281_t:CDS:2 [Acaulospora morrowiae]